MPEKDITEYFKYTRILDSIYMRCREKLGDNLIQDFAIEIMNTIEKGLE